jgi:glycerophosphoryl diester phosphodiesterase
VSKGDVQQAHGLGLKVVPWTIDTPDGIRGAAAAGVDALITNDPVMAKRALGLPVGPPPAARRPPPPNCSAAKTCTR